jgi:hypothetical protein
MTHSPQNHNDSQVLTFTLCVDDQPIADEVFVATIEVMSTIDTPPVAQVSILNGISTSTQSIFRNGSLLSISAGYDRCENRLFEGKLIAQHITSNQSEGDMLRLECQADPSHHQLNPAPEPVLDLNYAKDLKEMDLCLQKENHVSGIIFFKGSSFAIPKSPLKLNGINTQFNVVYSIEKVHHRLGDGEWTTEAAIRKISS